MNMLCSMLIVCILRKGIQVKMYLAKRIQVRNELRLSMDFHNSGWKEPEALNVYGMALKWGVWN